MPVLNRLFMDENFVIDQENVIFLFWL